MDKTYAQILSQSRANDREDDQDWLLSFTDMVIFLLGFFVILYAASSINHGKYEQIFQSIDGAIGKQGTALSIDDPNNYVGLLKIVQNSIKEHNLQAEVQANLGSRGVELTASGSLLYPSATTELGDKAQSILQKLAISVLPLNYSIHVEGHTDNLPIYSSQYPTNWELSAARASAVVRYLIELGIKPERLSATGFGATRPRNLADSPAARAQNRRVVIVFRKEM